MENGGFFDSDDSLSDFDGFTNDDLPGKSIDLNDNSSDVDLSSDSDDLPLSRFVNGDNYDDSDEEIEPDQLLELELPNRSWSSQLTDIQFDDFAEPVGAVNILGKDAREIDFFQQIFPV
jgi:hypothetical protein